MGHAAGLYLVGKTAVRCPTLSSFDGFHFETHLLVRRGFFRGLDFDEDAVGIGKPEALRTEAWWRIEQPDSGRFDAPPDRLEVLFKGRKGNVLQLFRRPLRQYAPAMRAVEGGKTEVISICFEVKAECRVKILRDSHLRNRHAEVIERVDAQLTGDAWLEG